MHTQWKPIFIYPKNVQVLYLSTILYGTTHHFTFNKMLSTGYRIVDNTASHEAIFFVHHEVVIVLKMEQCFGDGLYLRSRIKSGW